MSLLFIFQYFGIHVCMLCSAISLEVVNNSNADRQKARHH